MGMSQYGAQGAARLGCDYRTILDAYYRNTRLVRVAMTAPVQLSLLAGAGRASLLAESGTVRWTGGAVQPRGATWTVLRRGAGVAVRDAGRAREGLGARRDGARPRRTPATVVRVRAFRPGSMRASADLRTRWDRAQFVGTGGRIAVTQLIVDVRRAHRGPEVPVGPRRGAVELAAARRCARRSSPRARTWRRRRRTAPTG